MRQPARHRVDRGADRDGHHPGVEVGAELSHSGLDPVATREVHELIASLRERGVTIFITTHRLEEAERLCDRVAILSTSLRLIGGPDELRKRLFRRSLDVRVRAPLDDPKAVLGAVAQIKSWEQTPSGYRLSVSDSEIAAPQVARALVGAGADIFSLGESHQQLDQHVRSRVDRRDDGRVGEQSRGGEKDPEDRVGDQERRNERGQRLADEELLATDRGGQDRLERALLTLTDDRVGGDDRRHDHGDHEHVEQREPDANAEVPRRRVGCEQLDHLFTPLLAGWAIWVGIAVSARSTDVRVAQQLSVLASLPPLAILVLMSLNVIAESTGLALGLAAALLAVDLLAWRVRSGRNSSRTRAFDVAEGEIASFRCSGKSILPIFLLSFAVPSLALTLHRE